MKIFISVLTGLVLIGCANGGGGGSPSGFFQPPSPATENPIPTPTPVGPPPTPTPSLVYTCSNHPLTNTTLRNTSTGVQMTLSSDCSYVFQDAFHIGYGTWTPDSNPNNVTNDGIYAKFPMHLAPSSAYICLPANGPQNCSPSSYAGNVRIQLNAYILPMTTGLVIIP